MKILKRIVIASLFLTLLSGCNSSPHIHDWGSYFDNGDGTHSRICLKDVNHKETEKHTFKDEEIIVKPTETTPGQSKVVCSKCGYSELHELKPTGDHVFDKEVVDEKYLYEKCSDYSSIYYKSCECGAFGDPDYLFETSLLPEGYSNLEYIQGNGVQYIDVGVKNDENKSLKYNVCKQSSGRLPKDYQEVEYIESIGDQYIDTGFLVNKTDKVKLILDYQPSDNEVSWQGANWYLQISNGYLSDTYRHEFTITNNNGIETILMDDNLLRENDFTSASVKDCKLALFALGDYDNTWYTGNKAKGKLYHAEYYLNDQLLGDYIPCYEVETGKTGLYNLVNYTFYPNVGTGEFLLGNIVNPTSRLPKEYSELSYIESTGTQYIDLGWSTTDGMIVEYKASWSKQGHMVSSHSVSYPYGRNGIYPYLNENKWEFGYGETCLHYDAKKGANVNQIYNLYYSTLYDNAWAYVDGEKICECSGEHTSPTNIMLFCNAYQIEEKKVTEGKLYYCKIWDKHDVLVFDLIPVLREDGAAGMYDFVSKKFLANNGTGNFKYEFGNNSSKTTQLSAKTTQNTNISDGYTELEYIESNGNQYIDTGVAQNNKTTINCKFTYGNAPGIAAYLFGSRQNDKTFIYNGGYIRHIVPDYNDLYSLEYNYATIRFKTDNNKFDMKQTIIGNTISIEINGETIKRNVGENADGNNIYIFACNNEPVRLFNGELKCYSFSIVDDGELVRDYMPAMRNFDGEVGLYDKVENKFYKNLGTGKFVAGPKKISEYTELEYIKTNGTQYINTGFTPDNNTGIYAEFAFSSFENLDSILFSSGVDYNERAYELYPWDGKMEINYGPHCAYLEGIEYTPNDRIAYLQNKNNFKLHIGGSEFNYSFPTQEFVTPGPLTLFAWNREGRISPCAECVTLYSMQIYDGGTVVRDYVPVIRNSDGKVGLLDKLNNKFYGNDGTGEFIAGPRKTSEYTELEYIESTGSQYINTGINVGPNITSVIDWKINEITNTKNGWSELFGYTKDDSGKPYSIWGDGNKDLISLYTDAGKTNINRSNDRVTTTFVSNTEQTSGSIYVFSAGPDSPTYSEALNPYKLYSLQIFDGETLVRDFVPAVRNSDGAVGLLDKVNNKFYGNNGTGEFIAGPRKTSEYTELEYIESTGSQYIDTSVLYSNTHSYKLHTNVSYSTIEPLNQIIGFTGNAGNGIGTFNDTFWECEGSVCEKDVLYNLSWERTPTTCCRVINGFVYDGQVNTSDIEGFSLKLFATCRTATDLSLSYYCSMKMYSCQIFDDDVLVRDFVPVIRNSDGAVGLLDKVNNKFYGNDGTGEFIAGPRKDTPMEDILIGYQYGDYSPSYYYGRIYDAQIYDGDTLIRNLIPCIRNSDSQVGMYDLVNNVFYPTSSPAEFNNSGVIGHHLDEGRITKQATYKEDGTKEYTCSICGEKIVEKIPRLSYEVKFIGGEGVKEIRIYSNDKDLINYYVGDTAYSRNIFTYNYSKVNSGVYFEIVLEDGYTLEDISYDSSLCTYVEGEGYKMIYELQGDVVINVVTSKNP